MIFLTQLSQEGLQMLFHKLSPPFNMPSCTKNRRTIYILNEGHREGWYEVELSAVASRKQPNGLVGSKSVVNKLSIRGRKSSKNFEASLFSVVSASVHLGNESSRASHTSHPRRVTIFEGFLTRKGGKMLGKVILLSTTFEESMKMAGTIFLIYVPSIWSFTWCFLVDHTFYSYYHYFRWKTGDEAKRSVICWWCRNRWFRCHSG